MEKLIFVLYNLIFLVFSQNIYESFFIPKLIILYLTSIVVMIHLVRYQKKIMVSKQIMFFTLGLSIFSAIHSYISDNIVNGLIFSSALISLFLSTCFISTVQEKSYKIFSWILSINLIIQLTISILQVLHLNSYLPPTLIIDNRKAIGTFGNPEFLATFYGVFFFLSSYFKKKRTDKLFKVLSFLGLCLTLSKGSILIVLGIVFWNSKYGKPIYKKLLLGAVVLSIFTFNSYLKGRILLWMATILSLKDKVFGHGYLSFDSSYFDSVSILLRNDFLFNIFGQHSATVRDPHNLILQLTHDWGIVGLIFIILFYKEIYSSLNKINPIMRQILILLIIKSFYTVSINSITWLVLLSIPLGLASKREEPISTSINIKILLPTTIIFFIFMIAHYPHISWYHHNKAMKWLSIKNTTYAKPPLEKAMKYNSTDPEILLANAFYHFLKGENSIMKKNIDKVISKKRNMNTLKISAHMLYDSQNFSYAEKLYSKIITVFPYHLTSLVKLAKISMFKSNYKEAMFYAERTIKITPRVPMPSDKKNRAEANLILIDLQDLGFN